MKIEGSAEQPLRWKARPIPVATGSPGEVQQATGFSPIQITAVGSGVVHASNASEANAKTAGGWNKMRIDTYVTPAQATSPAKPDPFQDPFGDRRATQAALQLNQPGVNPPGVNQPNLNQPGLNQNDPRFNPGVQPMPAPNFQPPNFQPVPNVPALPPNAPANPPVEPDPFAPPAVNPPIPPPNDPNVPPNNTPPNNQPPNNLPPENAPRLPELQLPPSTLPGVPDVRPRGSADNNSPSNKPCDRIYNELNCCDTDANCRAFIQSVLRDRLSHISLDISPRLEPDKDDDENERIRQDRSRLSGVREWYRRNVKFDDRANNQPLAVGRLHDLQHGRVIVMEESGQTRQLPLNDLSEDDLCFVSGWWKLPAECAIAGHREIDVYSRGWMPSVVAWHASALCHKPLYFEQVQHERYGHSAGPIRQPFVDGAHFFGSAILLPYKMALDPPWECEYVLGYYRPGSCAPYHIPPFPFSPRAAMAQAGFVVGGIYIMP